MVRPAIKKKPVGRKNTVIKAIPKPLYRQILRIKLELEMKQKNNSKPKRITLLDAGIELARRVKWVHK